MKEIVRSVEDKLREFEEISRMVKKSLINAPEGILKISRCKNIPQYYHRKDKMDCSGKYINKENHSLAYKLAQKEYDEQVLKSLEEQQKRMQMFIKQIEKSDIANIYEQLSLERQKLVKPYVLPDEQYVKQWESVSYQGKSFDKDAPEIYTERGERVRSKSEKILADKFYMLGIPYRYEYPLHLNGYGVVFPDFMILNKRTRNEYYWEHLGKMDDSEYCKKAIKKIGEYQKNQIFSGKKLLLTYETSTYPLNMKDADNLIQKFLL